MKSQVAEGQATQLFVKPGLKNRSMEGLGTKRIKNLAGQTLFVGPNPCFPVQITGFGTQSQHRFVRFIDLDWVML